MNQTVRLTGSRDWKPDHQFYWLTTILFALGFAWSVLPAGLVFDPVRREALSAAGNTGFREQWMPLMLLASGVIVARFRLLTVLVPAAINPWLLVTLAWMLASAAWAPDAAATARQAISLVGVLLIALAFALASWRQDRFTQVMLPLLTGLMLASLVVGFALPNIGVQSEDQFELAGSWRGITFQKNGLGQLCSMSLILWAHAGLSRRARPLRALAGALLSVFLVLKSRSSTSLLLSIIACGVLVLMLRPPLRVDFGWRLLLGLIALLAVAGLLLFVALSGVLDTNALAQSFGSIFGKDATFSGRTPIWAELMDEIPRHSLLGTGLMSFWGSPAANGAVARLGWQVPNGHSGYLDLINETGLIGGALFLAFLVRHGRDLARLWQVDPVQSALHTALFVYLLMANFTETGWFHPISATHVVICYSSVVISRIRFEALLQTADRAAPRIFPAMKY